MIDSPLFSRSYASPWGRLLLTATEEAIISLTWSTRRAAVSNSLLDQAVEQLVDYAGGRLRCFDLPLAPSGTPFQQQVYAVMSAIPFGETRSYGDVAKELGSAAQPVGQACGSNPIPIIIPCHRILGADGLGGFSAPGGVEMKIQLLKHEDAFPYLL